MATHVVAAASFARLRRQAPAADLFTVLRERDVVMVPRDELAADVVAVCERLRELERQGCVILSSAVRDGSGGDVIEHALRAFKGFHSAPVLASRADGISICDTNLLFYYQNRLAAHGVAWDVLGQGDAALAGPVRPLPSLQASQAAHSAAKDGTASLGAAEAVSGAARGAVAGHGGAQ
jgi:glycerol-3-phosphate O-acyltransferase